jgi:uncharacterized protein (TIGR03437 family)
MKTLLLLTLGISLSAVATLAAGPTIASPGVYNSASYALSAFPNGGIAQGSIFVVFGSGLGPSTIAYNSSLPYQTSLSGTSVSVSVGGQNVPCYMFYTSAGQVAAILPSSTPTGTGTITVTYNNAASNAAPITVVKNSLGLFTRNQQGSGPGVIQDSNSNYNALTYAFQPGETVTFWGTGLGPISGSDATTPPSGNLPGTTVTANIGGQNAVVQYAGRSGFAGEDQINVTIPSGVSGCYVPVYMTVNGVPSNFVSISVTNSGAVCSDPNLYTSTDLQNVAAGGTLRSGGIILEQETLTITIPGFPLPLSPEEDEEGTAGFGTYTANTFLSSLGGLNTLALSQGCTVYYFSASGFEDPIQPTGLDAGAAINVTGPNGTKQLAKQSLGQYSTTFVAPSLSLGGPAPTKFLTPGTYTLDNGTGGADVGAFKVNLTIPQPVTWSNKSNVTTVLRTQPLPIDWTGGAPSGLVYVVGISPLAVDATNGSFTGGAEFVCVAPSSAGTLTVPAAILSALPPSANISEDGINIGGGFIIVSSSSTVTATVPGLDVFEAGASSGDGKIGVAFQ